jgi:hypothetical protein
MTSLHRDRIVLAVCTLVGVAFFVAAVQAIYTFIP